MPPSLPAKRYGMKAYSRFRKKTNAIMPPTFYHAASSFHITCSERARRMNLAVNKTTTASQTSRNGSTARKTVNITPQQQAERRSGTIRTRTADKQQGSEYASRQGTHTADSA